MRYRLLGKSGLRVSEICLGTMTFGTEFKWGSNQKQSRKVFDTYADYGGNFLDTANYYTKGTSEQMIGSFLKGKRHQFVVATKYSLTSNPLDPNAGGNHRKSLKQAVDASLKRLQTDYIDLYWIHAWDFMTPIEEILRALDDVIRAGKVLYIGISNTPCWIVSYANAIANLKGWTEFIGMQLEYSLVERTIEREFVPMAKSLNLAILAWSPLAMGILTGKYTQGKSKSKKSRFDINPKMGERYLNKRNLKIAETVCKVAKDINKTPAQVALKWVMQRPGNVIPIIGAKTHTQLEDSLECTRFQLDDKHIQTLDKASHISLGYPHDFLAMEGIKKLVHGDTLDLVSNQRKTIL